MFTGIIQAVGTVSRVAAQGGDIRLVIDAPALEKEAIALGDSIAVNGVCLTAVALNGAELAFDVSRETIDHSLIGTWQNGSRVNLELAMLPTTRLGGHLVSGHVDGLAEIRERHEDARSWRMLFEVPTDLQKYIARKGSVTLNGVSLTVNKVSKNTFDINVIPHTLEVTTLGNLRPGDRAHIEVDLLARYLERLLDNETEPDSKITGSLLADHGFA